MGPTCNSVGPIWLGFRAQRNLGKTDYTNSVRPILVISFPESWSGKLGGTDYSNSVGPILVISYPESLHCNIGSTNCSNSVRPILIMDIHREITIPSR